MGVTKDKTILTLTELSIMRVFATILVVFSHSFFLFTYGRYSDLDVSSIEFVKVTIKDVIVKFNMPLFVFISGFLLQWTLCNKNVDYFNFIKKKAKRLLIPYICFAPITLLSISDITDKNVTQLVHPIGHLWFILMLFIVFALIYPVRDYFHSKALLSILLVSTFLLSFVPITPFENLMGGGNFLTINDIKKLLVFFILGIVVCRYRRIIGENKIIAISIIIFSLVVILFAHFLHIHFFEIGRFTLAFLFNTLQGIAYCMLFYILTLLFSKSKISLVLVDSTLFRKLDRYSFGIYLFHVVILNFFCFIPVCLTFACKYPLLYGCIVFFVSLYLSALLTHLCMSKQVGRFVIGSGQ